MVFERQRRLLALVDALGGAVPALDFQKLLFLYTREEESEPSYDFVPYRFGGFSFTSYADKRRLIELGLLGNEERQWTLTETGKVLAKQFGPERLRMDAFAHRRSGLRGDALVAEVYRRFPYYATRSEISERVLAGDAPALKEIAKAGRGEERAYPPALYTIGYEGRSLEEYLNRLIRAGVTLLCDVRRNPLSRKYGFSKGTLARTCEGVGLRYEHLPELGIASDRRRELKSQADYDALFADYEREDLPGQGAALARIAGWVKDGGHRVALTCFEHAPEQCHRRCIAKALERSFGRTLAPSHL
ncbi:MAG: DUF488 domain-containing protein [Verrucomicrobiae bacterium]|nr:DUF488 domain-containing protein [Verrucomicrobiae bacterium]